jgi:hypothetical protein
VEDALADHRVRLHEAARGHVLHVAHREPGVVERLETRFAAEVGDVAVLVATELQHAGAGDECFAHGRLSSRIRCQLFAGRK